MSDSESQKFQSASAKFVPNGKVGQGVPNNSQNNIKEQSKPPGFLAGFFKGIGGGGSSGGNGSNGGNGGNGWNGDDDYFDDDDYRHDTPDMGDVVTLAYIQYQN